MHILKFKLITLEENVLQINMVYNLTLSGEVHCLPLTSIMRKERECESQIWLNKCLAMLQKKRAKTEIHYIPNILAMKMLKF